MSHHGFQQSFSKLYVSFTRLFSADADGDDEKLTEIKRIHKIVLNKPGLNGKKERDFERELEAQKCWDSYELQPSYSTIARIWYSRNEIEDESNDKSNFWEINKTFGNINDLNEIKNYCSNKYQLEIFTTDLFDDEEDDNNDNNEIKHIHSTHDLLSIVSGDSSLYLTSDKSYDQNDNDDDLRPDEDIIFTPRLHGTSHYGMNEIIGKYYEYMQDNTYYKDDKRGKFLAFTESNNINEKEMWSQLFEKEAKDCIYCKFDKNLPSFDSDNREEKYSKDLNGINYCLRDYYLAFGRKYDFNKFKEYLESNGIDEQDVIDEFLNIEFTECGLELIDIDENFPFQNYPQNDEEKNYEIFQVIRHGFKYGNSYPVKLSFNLIKMREFLRYCYINGQPPKPLMKINEFDLSILTNKNKQKKTIKKAQKMIEIQTNKIFYQNVLNDIQYITIFSVGYNHGNYNFLLYIMDSFQREKIFQFIENNKQIDIKQWIETNKILKNEKKIKVNTQFLCCALRGNIRHYRKTLILYPEVKIYDDIIIISKYIISFSQFVYKYLLKYKGYTTPISIDCMIAVYDCKRYENISDNNNKQHNATMSEDLNFDKRNNIGNIKNKLTAEHCVWVSDLIEDPSQINDKIGFCFEKFKQRMHQTRNCDKHYPTNRRFCIFIDRRKGHNNLGFDEIIIYSPPNNCNIIPKNHIPQSISVMSNECLIPYIGYNQGEIKNPTPYNINKHVFSKISTDTHCQGGLLTFCFHCESVEEIRLYMYWYGQSLRFYPQDINDILPIIFDKNYKLNKNFKDSIHAKSMINGIFINDKYFEHFYRHLTQKKENQFPTKKYKGYSWPINEILVFGQIRKIKKDANLIIPQEIYSLILNYFCYY